MLGTLGRFFREHAHTIAAIAVSTLVFVAVTALTGGLGAPLLAALAAGGVSSGVAGYLVGQWLAKLPVTARGLVTSALVSGVVTLATAGLGRFITPFVPVSAPFGSVTAAFQTATVDAVAGGAIGGGVTVAQNAVAGRPLTENLGKGVATGAATGVFVRPLANAIGAPIAERAAALRDSSVQTPTKGMAQALLDGGNDGPTPPVEALPAPRATETPASDSSTVTHRGPRGPPEGELGYASVHEAPPAWLAARFDRTVADVRAGRAVPGTDPEQVAAFLHETYEHVNEVNQLAAAIGGKSRAIPENLAPDATLRGVHDFGERVSLRRFEEFVAKAHETPIKDRQGNEVPVPEWLDRYLAEVRASGETTVDVGKMNPYVASGLARQGPPEAYALAVHNLSPHHTLSAMRGQPLIEAIADRVNAMRQVRVYRPKPMPFEQIEKFILEDVKAGKLPAEAEPLVHKAIEAEKSLEASGKVNPYHRAP